MAKRFGTHITTFTTYDVTAGDPEGHDSRSRKAAQGDGLP